MPAYSNRPNYGEPMPLGSGDFESLSYEPPRSPYGSMPRAPRNPAAFASQPHYAQTGPFRPLTGPSFPADASSRHSIPQPAHSLAPMAMPSARGAMGTGPQIAQMPNVTPIHENGRPSTKVGMAILLVGALIGGLVGAVVHARQTAEIALAATQSASDDAMLANPVAPASAAPIPSASAHVADAKDEKADKAEKTEKTEKKASTKKTAWKGGAKIAAEKPSKDDDDDAAPAPAKPSKAKKSAGKDDDGYTIASADDDDVPAKPKAADKKKAAAEKTTAALAKDDAPAKKSAPSKGGDDAVNVLKAAMGATENSL